MTIGNRIAQIRKENGLSQEAFGESLGVTRQSISKWEADQSIPDVDKLMAMHKLYGVSIGWILGEKTEEKTDESQELTEEQIKMVEMIAEKYISAIPKTAPVTPAASVKKNKGLRVAGIVAVVIGIFYLINFLSGLESRIANVQSDMNNIQYNVSNEISGITAQVESALQAQNSLLADSDYYLEDVDLKNNTFTYSAYVTPKSYVEGMKVDFIFEAEGQTYRVEGIADENHKFYGMVEMPLADYMEISVIISDGTTEQMQYLGNEMIYEEDYWVSGNAGTDNLSEAFHYWKLKKEYNFTTVLYTQEVKTSNGVETIRPEKAVWKAFINNEKVVEQEAKLTQEAGADWVYEASARLPLDFIKEAETEDMIYVMLVVTDNYGRTYVSSLDACMKEKDGSFAVYYPDYDRQDERWLQ